MDKHTIIKLHQKGDSNRSISKITGINRKTIGKYVNEYKANIIALTDEATDVKEVQEKILAAPTFDSSSRSKRKYTSDIDRLLDSILESELTKDKVLKNHKISLTTHQIHKKIIDAGYDISFTTIYNQIKIKKAKAKECFIKQVYEYGDRLEFDFGEVDLILDGIKTKCHMAVLSSPGGEFRWSYLYKNQKKDVFLNAHVEFFEMLGGVYKEVVYDNMRNVVTKFIGKNEKELNQELLNLSLYYGFDINVTNAFSGNEKGYVESSVKVLRREIFGPKYEFNSLEEARVYMNGQLEIINKNSKIEEEKECLLPYKPKLDLADIREVTINKYSFARIDNNSYSVPDYLVGKKLIAKIYYESIRFYSNNQYVFEHKKIDGSNEIRIDIRHYLKTFERKPGALNNSLALKSLPELKSIYDVYFKSNPKKFIGLLTKYQGLNYRTMIRALKDEAVFTKETTSSNTINSIIVSQLNLYNCLSVGGGGKWMK